MRVVKNMAKTIAATPTLTGKDTVRIFGNLDIPVTPEKKEILKRIP